MSQTELDQLLDQLFLEDPKQRRSAAKLLGELGRPEAIADLVNVYNKDADPSVRRAAEDALRVFRRKEHEMLGVHIDDDEGSGGPDLSPILRIARMGLIGVLAITIFVNVAVLIGKAIPVSLPTTPTLSAPTDRAALVDSFTKRIAASKAEANILSQLMRGIQGLSMSGIKQDQCQQLASSTLNTADLDPMDARTYPDLKAVSEALNIPALKIVAVRNTYTLLCGTKTQADFDKMLADQGPADRLVARIDEVLNKDLPEADGLLKKAIEQPAPTVGPTATPTLTATATLPTATPTSIPTITPTLAATIAGATPVAGSTVGAGGVATEAPTIAAQGSSYTLNGLGLESLSSFKYRVVGTTNGTYPSNKTFKGSLSFVAQKQTSPLQAQYDVTISEGSPTIAFFKPYLPTLYAQGSSTFVLVNDNLYETGSVLDAAKYNGRCRVSAGAQGAARLQDFTFGNLSDFTLTAQAGTQVINGESAVHYHGERPVGASGELYQTLDVYVSTRNGIPVQIHSVRTINPKADAATKAKSGLKDFTEDITYDLLAQQVAVQVLKPIVCS